MKVYFKVQDLVIKFELMNIQIFISKIEFVKRLILKRKNDITIYLINSID